MNERQGTIKSSSRYNSNPCAHKHGSCQSAFQGVKGQPWFPGRQPFVVAESVSVCVCVYVPALVAIVTRVLVLPGSPGDRNTVGGVYVEGQQGAH